MIKKSALVRTGERRHARYAVGISLRPVSAVKVAVKVKEDGNLRG
jgi:hypothetical protein